VIIYKGSISAVAMPIDRNKNDCLLYLLVIYCMFFTKVFVGSVALVIKKDL